MGAVEDRIKELEDKYNLGGSNRASDLEHGLEKDPGDLEGYFADLDKQYQLRATNTPGDEDGDGVDDRTSGGSGPGSSGSGGFGYPGGSGTGTNYPRDGGVGASTAQLSELMNSISAINKDPVQLPEYDLPSADDLAIEIPGENLSPAIDDTLLDLMGRNDDPLGLEGRYRTALDEGPADPLGLQGILSDLLARTKGGGVNSERLQTRNEASREQLSRGSSAALADLRAVLADRGLLGDGLEQGETARVFEPLQRDYLAELRQSMLDESQLADQAELNAIDRGQTFTAQQQAVQSDLLGKATGWSQGQVQQRLAAATSGTERQQIMSDIALRQLEDNMSWNKFLAEFGLKREQVAEDIRAGRIAAVQPVLQMFLSLLGQSRGGYI